MELSFPWSCNSSERGGLFLLLTLRLLILPLGVSPSRNWRVESQFDLWHFWTLLGTNGVRWPGARSEIVSRLRRDLVIVSSEKCLGGAIQISMHPKHTQKYYGDKPEPSPKFRLQRKHRSWIRIFAFFLFLTRFCVACSVAISNRKQSWPIFRPSVGLLSQMEAANESMERKVENTVDNNSKLTSISRHFLILFLFLFLPLFHTQSDLN